ncbi:nitroreductase [Bacillus sp. NMCC4]|nr:nitroreductase [Bacillus sp. NMCC4]
MKPFHHHGFFIKICLKRNMIVTLLEKVKQLFSRQEGKHHLQIALNDVYNVNENQFQLRLIERMTDMPEIKQQTEALTIRDAVRYRRSIRKFKETPVTIEQLQPLLEDAVYAPNHKITEPWRFLYAVTDEAKATFVDRFIAFFQRNNPDAKEEKINQYRDYFSKVPALLLVVLKEDENPVVRNDDFAAVSALIQNFQLLAWDQGIGMVWKSGRILYDKGFQQDMGLKENERFAAILHIGYPEEVPEEKSRQKASSLLTEIQ